MWRRPVPPAGEALAVWSRYCPSSRLRFDATSDRARIAPSGRTSHATRLVAMRRPLLAVLAANGGRASASLRGLGVKSTTSPVLPRPRPCTAEEARADGGAHLRPRKSAQAKRRPRHCPARGRAPASRRRMGSPPRTSRTAPGARPGNPKNKPGQPTQHRPTGQRLRRRTLPARGAQRTLPQYHRTNSVPGHRPQH
jgi:hypothetical protein